MIGFSNSRTCLRSRSNLSYFPRWKERMDAGWK